MNLYLFDHVYGFNDAVNQHKLVAFFRDAVFPADLVEPEPDFPFGPAGPALGQGNLVFVNRRAEIGYQLAGRIIHLYRFADVLDVVYFPFIGRAKRGECNQQDNLL